MVHYPTDVIAALIVGAVAAICSCLLMGAIWRAMGKRSHVGIFAFALTFDIRSLFKKKKALSEVTAEESAEDTEDGQ